MKLIALCGAAGAGKDTVADMLPARKLAFADTLYAEVAAAWGVEQHVLRCRETKETPTPALCLARCDERAFSDFISAPCSLLTRAEPRSPRQILQWWGDYRRAQSPDYFVARTWQTLCEHMMRDESAVLTDVRFPNEAAMVRQLGGQIWQIKRPGYEAGGTGHASDTDGSEFGPDRVIVNCGSLDYLRDQVFEAWGGSIMAWINPNDKTQKQYLPHIGERVLFKYQGRVYLGKHTGGGFKSEYPLGRHFDTWQCLWMYPECLD